MRAPRLLFAIVAGSLFYGSVAHADDPNACITPYEQTQSLRKDGKLREAKEQAILCSRDSCAKVLAKDCARWVAELDESIPSIVFEVKTPDGNELLNVTVSMDAKPLVSNLDGKSVPVDPGPHKFRFETPGYPAAETQTIVREGEKNRKVSVTLRSGAAGARPVPFMTYVFGGVGVLGLAGFTVFGIKGLSDKSTLDKCRPSCNPSDVDSLSHNYAIADVALGVGVVSLVAAAYVFFSRPTVTDAESSSGANAPRFRPTPNGFALSF